MNDRVINLKPQEFRDKHNSLEARVALIEAALGGIEFDLTDLEDNDRLQYNGVTGKFEPVDAPA